ncbi:MAG: TldD/PmbA family protein [Rhodomicrobium sp.]
MSGSLDAAPTEFAEHLVERAMRGGADAAQVTATRSNYFEIDFSERGIDLLRSITNSSASITIFRDDKLGSASVNGCNADDIEAALAAAQTAADAGIKDPANGIADAPLLPKGEYGHKEPQRDAMIASAEGFIQELSQRYPAIRTRNSISSFSDFERSFANSLGVRQSERRGRYGFGAGFCGKDGRRTTSVNYSGAASFEPFERLLGVGTVQRLIEETLRSFERKPVPGKFVGDVIITPDCLRSLMGSITNALSGSALFAGTTPYKGRKGEQIASEKFSLLNRPRSPEFPGGADFDGFGIPTKDLDVVKDGVLNEFLIGFFMARKLGVPQTAGAWNFLVPPGDTPIDEIVAKTRRGVVFSRFSGGRPNSNLDFSGVAKNSFYVEDGEVKHALGETMVSGNFQALLKQIHAVSRECVNFGGSCYPYVAASGVTISSR